MKEITNTTDIGWVKLHRSIQDHWIWKDPLKLKWWIDIIMVVNHADSKVNLGLKIIECKRGQSVMSLSGWAKRWGVSKSMVRNFFNLLENDGMIIQENVTKSTRITVCNYDSYQDVAHARKTHEDPNKNDKNNIDSYSNNLYRSNEVYSFDDFWNDYDKKVGDKTKLKVKWSKISNADKLKIKAHIPEYKKAQPDKSYRKNPETYLNNKSWNDEIIKSPYLKDKEEPVKRYRTLDIELNDNFIE